MARNSHNPDNLVPPAIQDEREIPFLDPDDFPFMGLLDTGASPDADNTDPTTQPVRRPPSSRREDFMAFMDKDPPYNPPVPAVAPVRSDVGFRDNERLVKRYNCLLEPLPIQPVTNSPDFIFDTLSAEFPNFVEALDYICSFVSMAHLGQGPVYFPPLLLDGPPGIGKTRFAMRIAGLCNAGFDMLSCGGASSTMAIVGSEQGYSESRPGFYAETFKKNRVINNVILLDEVEKMEADGRGGDPYAALLPLLEQTTARMHRDVCLHETINLGYLSYILTANSVHTLPEPLMTRVRMVRVPPPDASQLDRIVPYVLDEIKACYNLHNYDFVPDMDEIRRGYAMEPNIRNLKAMIEYQIRATLWKPRGGRIGFTRSVQKASIGFAR